MESVIQFDNTAKTPAKKLEALVWKFVGERRAREAISVCDQLNRDYPASASGWHTASQLALRLDNTARALQAIDRALALEPDSRDWQLQRGNCLIRLGRLADAEPVILQLCQLAVGTAYQCSTLGLLLTRLEQHELALPQYQRAVSLEPNNAQHYYNLASVERFLGDFSAAEKSLNTAIKLNPGDYEAWKLRSDLRIWDTDKNHVSEIRTTLAAGVKDPRGQVNLNYALAKELEDLGDNDASFRHLDLGATTRRRHMRYELAGDLDTMTRIREIYSNDLFERNIAGSDNGEPIFILGMPRTGTTLAERILASHSDVFAAGELSNFARQLTALAGRKQVPKEQLVERSAGLNFAELGENYIASTRPLTGHTPRFIDKLPLNFLYTGLIHLALPQAKIVHVVRDPMDTCYAVYKTLFKDAYPFSYDLKELGDYYLAYHRLMDHWNTVLPGVIHTVHYEDLVMHADRQSRVLLAACELPWQDQCLRFYENRSASTTASASQIRQPIYQSSVGKWKNCAKQLQPLVDQFRGAGLTIDE